MPDENKRGLTWKDISLGVAGGLIIYNWGTNILIWIFGWAVHSLFDKPINLWKP
jgi:hypothetical protein